MLARHKKGTILRDARAAMQKVHDLIQSLADDLAPSEDDVDDGEWTNPEMMMLDKFVMVAAWIDSNGDTWTATMMPPNTSSYQAVGLMYTGLGNM